MPIALAADEVAGASAERTILFLHGILGRGNNLRTLARRFVEARPQWTARLLDLRGHGKSPKSTPGASLEAAAQDVVSFTVATVPAVGAIVGHSFGGKVALEVARLGERLPLEHVVVIDSVPGVRQTLQGSDSPLAIIDTIKSLPPKFQSSNAFIDAFVRAGRPRPLAQWLAQSLERRADGVVFALDLEEIRALILDYLARDLWPVVEQPPGGTAVHLIIGERSAAFSTADRERAARIAGATPRVTVDLLPAGHWVPVDDPDGLLRTLLDRIGG